MLIEFTIAEMTLEKSTPSLNGRFLLLTKYKVLLSLIFLPKIIELLFQTILTIKIAHDSISIQ